MNKENLEGLLREVETAFGVVGDVALGGDKQDAEQTTQLLLAHINKVIQLVKRVAAPHQLEVHLHGATLRYPEDCDASYQLDDKYIEEQKANNDAFIRQYGENLEKRKKSGNYEPKFLGDAIWDSSENCSDQGLSMFGSYDDFAMNRGDYNWLKKVDE